MNELIRSHLTHPSSPPCGTAATPCDLSGLETNMHANEATVDCAAYTFGAVFATAFAFALAFGLVESEVDDVPAST